MISLRVVVQRCPAVPTAPNNAPIKRHVQVGMFANNDGVVAAKFQHDFCPAVRHCRTHRFTHAG